MAVAVVTVLGGVRANCRLEPKGAVQSCMVWTMGAGGADALGRLTIRLVGTTFLITGLWLLLVALFVAPFVLILGVLVATVLGVTVELFLVAAGVFLTD